jgi:hypothetical protein
MRYSCEGVCPAVPLFRRCRSARPNCETGNDDDEMPTLSTEKTMTVAFYICSPRSSASLREVSTTSNHGSSIGTTSATSRTEMPGQAISGSHADEHEGDLSADRRIVGYSVSPGAHCLLSESVVREQYERFSRGSGTVAAIVVVRRKD